MIIYKKNRGFTLIELIVAIAIVGILITITVISINNSRRHGRDAKRVSDITQIQNALALYFRDEGFYPAQLIPNEPLTSARGVVYLNKIPSAPSQVDGNDSCSTTTNAYTYTATEKSYTLSYCLGGKTQSLLPGIHCATPTGDKPGVCPDL